VHRDAKLDRFLPIYIRGTHIGLSYYVSSSIDAQRNAPRIHEKSTRERSIRIQNPFRDVVTRCARSLVRERTTGKLLQQKFQSLRQPSGGRMSGKQ